MLRVLLDEDNDLPEGGPVLASGIDSAATALQAVFSTQAGSWPYSFVFGVDWRSEVLVKYFNPATTRALMAEEANTVPDIQPVVPSQVLLDTLTNADARQVEITIEDVIVGSDVATITVSTEL